MVGFFIRFLFTLLVVTFGLAVYRGLARALSGGNRRRAGEGPKKPRASRRERFGFRRDEVTDVPYREVREEADPQEVSPGTDR